MFYQVRANLFFADPDEAVDFYHDCQVALPKSSIIQPDEINEERGEISLEICHHDVTPPLPCELLNSAQVGT